MRRLCLLTRFLAVVFALFTQFTSMTVAQPSEACGPSIPSNEVVESLVGWIALHTSYDVSQTYREPPEIVFCGVGETVPYESGELIVDPLLSAAYDLEKRLVYLVLPWDEENPRDVSVLLHELIHDVQLSNREWPCIGAPEFEAYWLQHMWLAENDVASGFDWALIQRVSTCPAE